MAAVHSEEMARAVGQAIAPALEAGGARRGMLLALCEGLRLSPAEAEAALAAANAREPAAGAGPPSGAVPPALPAAQDATVAALQTEVAALRAEVAALRAQAQRAGGERQGHVEEAGEENVAHALRLPHRVRVRVSGVLPNGCECHLQAPPCHHCP